MHAAAAKSQGHLPSHARAASCQAQSTLVPCKYKTGAILGKGTYAVVKEMVHIDSGRRYAGKVIPRNKIQDNRKLVDNEIQILRQVSRRHPNLLTLVDYFETQHNTYLVTELCEGGELFEYIHRRSSLEEAEAVHVMRQIVEGVAFLHANGIMHRDLKTENCLVRTDASGALSSIAIADFGMAENVPSDSRRVPTNICGTLGYMAPEMIRRTGHSLPVDMWAIGVIAYFVLSGTNPFQNHQSRTELHAITTAKYDFRPAHRWARVSDTARDFISSLLVADPARRMTAKQALAHPWLRGCALSPVHMYSPLDSLYTRDFDARCIVSSGNYSSVTTRQGTGAAAALQQFSAGVPVSAVASAHKRCKLGAAQDVSLGVPAHHQNACLEQKQKQKQQQQQQQQHKNVPADSPSSQFTHVNATLLSRSSGDTSSATPRTTGTQPSADDLGTAAAVPPQYNYSPAASPLYPVQECYDLASHQRPVYQFATMCGRGKHNWTPPATASGGAAFAGLPGSGVRR